VIVSCPACGTSFAVDDSLIGPSGRKVRCAKCAHRWHQLPTAEPAAPAPAPVTAEAMPSIEPSASAQMAAIAAAISERLAAAPEAGSAPPVPDHVADTAIPDIPAAVIRTRSGRADEKAAIATTRRPRKRRALLILGIILGFLIAVPSAGYVWRAKIARSAPWAQDMYSLLGIRTDDPLEDLDLANIKIVKRTVNSKPAVEITGDVFNKAQYPVEVPQLTATALGADGKPMPSPYRFRLQQQVLEPGETASFRVVYDGFPGDLKGVNVAFDDHPAE
jgi:predicted Zn finger-like uncharacterized protein